LRTKCPEQYHTAAFFFNAGGDIEERTPLGMFRSLLYQLLQYRHDELGSLAKVHQEKSSNNGAPIGVTWQEIELRSFFQSMFERSSGTRTIIFLDAVDECELESTRELFDFFRKLTETAQDRGIALDVCLSSRHFPTTTVNSCLEIIVETFNGPDIALYIDDALTGSILNKEGWQGLKQLIAEQSRGVFLWVVLVVDLLLKNRDDGMSLRYMKNRVSRVPKDLQDLFKTILDVKKEDLPATIRLFQWVILAQQPLRIREWYHILSFVRGEALSSLGQWNRSEISAENDDQLVKQIRNISKGLVEVTASVDTEELDEDCFDEGSRYAGAGSLDSRAGETRIVRVIHESVREFFLAENGFCFLNPSLGSGAVGSGHVQIMHDCLSYIGISELDSLVTARRAVSLRHGRRRHRRASSVASFSSAGSGRLLHQVPLDSECAPKTRDEISFDSDDVPESILLSLSPRDEIPFDSDYVPVLSRSPTQSWTDLHASRSPSNSLQSIKTRTLECYPALLHYASMMMFVHAKLAEKEGGDASAIMEMFRNGENWARWLALMEDIPRETDLIKYAAQQNLVSWVEYLTEAFDLA
jgi:hypothetical protein